MTEPNIYLDQQGNYRDRTEENLAAYPPADTDEVTGDGTGEPLPPAEEGSTVMRESGSDVPPVATEPDAGTAKTRKS